MDRLGNAAAPPRVMADKNLTKQAMKPARYPLSPHDANSCLRRIQARIALQSDIPATRIYRRGCGKTTYAEV
jgi:hypothetical protein